MFIPEVPPAIPASTNPAQLMAACEVCEVEPGELLAWAVKKDELVLILPTGQKVKFLIVGEWVNPPLPWEMEAPPAADHLPKVGSFDLPPLFEDGGLPPGSVPLFEDGGQPVVQNEPDLPAKRSPGKGKRG
jgi:hypothetical protein